MIISLFGFCFPTSTLQAFLLHFLPDFFHFRDLLKLCYPLYNNEELNHVLIPDLLPKEEKFTGESWDDKDVLVFEYHYNVLPISIFTRFVVQVHESIHKNTVWRTGVLLTNNYNMALVIVDRAERRVQMKVQGEPTVRQMAWLQSLREELESIHNSIAQLEVKKYIPISNSVDEVVSYYNLLEFEQASIKKFPQRVGGKLHQLNVEELLNGIAKTKQDLEIFPNTNLFSMMGFPEMSVSTPKLAIPEVRNEDLDDPIQQQNADSSQDIQKDFTYRFILILVGFVTLYVLIGDVSRAILAGVLMVVLVILVYYGQRLLTEEGLREILGRFFDFVGGFWSMFKKSIGKDEDKS